MYYKILEDFGTKRELISKTYTYEALNHSELLSFANTLFDEKKNSVLINRDNNEYHFYNFLEHQLFAQLQEIKFYSKVNVFDTRRLVATSRDCISLIQILIRDKIYLNVYFRSSDFDGAFLVDLKWICTLPTRLIEHLEKMMNQKGYEEVSENSLVVLRNMNVELSLMFGSLHRIDYDIHTQTKREI